VIRTVADVLKPRLQASAKISTGPLFVEKVVDVVGL
jgi:hypothetical protein